MAEYAPYITAIAAIVVGALSLYGLLRGHRSSPYEALARRVTDLEAQVDSLREEREESRRAVSILTEERDELRGELEQMRRNILAEREETRVYLRALFAAHRAGQALPDPPPWYEHR